MAEGKIKKGAGQLEESPTYQEAGVYELEREDGTISRLIIRDHLKYGTPGADAAVRVGYKFVRPATEEELAPMVYPVGEGAEAGTGTKGEAMVPKAQLDALMARIEALEGGKKDAKKSEDGASKKEDESKGATK